jgi:hypothetical protein
VELHTLQMEEVEELVILLHHLDQVVLVVGLQ